MPNLLHKSACRGQTTTFLANLAGSRSRSESYPNSERGLHPPLPDLTETYKISHGHKLLCQSSQGQLHVRGITSTYSQKRSGTGAKPKIPRVFQPKPNNKWRPILDLSNLNVFLKVEKFKIETPETIRAALHQGEWVTSIDFRDAYFHIPIQE